jgi:hypothetical protein
MRVLIRTVGLLAVLSMPTGAWAQAIAGVVTDNSGAVLPGVTVEASSPALIEKVRTATTDGSGRYRIESLQPGNYTITFSLAGFSTVKREGVNITGTGVTTIDGQLSVGGLQ